MNHISAETLTILPMISSGINSPPSDVICPSDSNKNADVLNLT